MSLLKEKYIKDVIPALKERFDYGSVMAVPKIEKVTINTGFGKLVSGKTGDDLRKSIEGILGDLSQVAGQKAVATRAKKSIAGFKMREGTAIGAKTTLRGKRMYDFLDRFVHIVLPRSRDFQGIERSSVDGQGNLTIGIKEHIFFPEISPEKIRNMFGLEVTITTTAKTQEEGLELFSQLGFPIKKQ